MVLNRKDLESCWTFNLSEINKRIEGLKKKWDEAIVSTSDYEKNGIKDKTYIISDTISLCFVPGYKREFRCLVMIDKEKSGNLTKSAINEFKFNATTVSTAKLLLEILDKAEECWVRYIEYVDKRHSMEYMENNARHALNSALEDKIRLEELRCEYMGKKVSVCSKEIASIISGVISDVYISNFNNAFARISTEDKDFYCHINELG